MPARGACVRRGSATLARVFRTVPSATTVCPVVPALDAEPPFCRPPRARSATAGGRSRPVAAGQDEREGARSSARTSAAARAAVRRRRPGAGTGSSPSTSPTPRTRRFGGSYSHSRWWRGGARRGGTSGAAAPAPELAAVVRRLADDVAVGVQELHDLVEPGAPAGEDPGHVLHDDEPGRPVAPRLEGEEDPAHRERAHVAVAIGRGDGCRRQPESSCTAAR